jgi:biofilm PGA synthesis N-glycosyltransferase PgaC
MIFYVSFLIALFWGIFSTWVAIPWITDLANLTNIFVAIFIIGGIAIIPGIINLFLITSLSLDTRKTKTSNLNFPDITVLIAAFNEENNILTTVKSIIVQKYPKKINIIVISDGSTDRTVKRLNQYSDKIKIIDLPKNKGKAAALNHGLNLVDTELVITIDADCYLYKNALVNIVSKYLNSSNNTAAVAGSILVKNSRTNIITRIQEWDYFLGINAVKRVQSLFGGTLVAQGAFSLYNTEILKSLGGWQNTVGEDIVLTWELLDRNYNIDFCKNAISFTNVPDTLKQFIKQRQRWGRGLIEAFKRSWRLLFKRHYITLLIWWNLFFPYLDLTYTLFFIPGIIFAFFGYYFIVGPLTLLLIPTSILMNYIIMRFHRKTFNQEGLKIRKNMIGVFLYVFFYSMILQPAAVVGYFKELLLFPKKWGTK